MTKGIVITEHGYCNDIEFSTFKEIQDVTKGYFEGMTLYDVTGQTVGYMYMNEFNHGLINTPASALSFMFGGASTIHGTVLVTGAPDSEGANTDVLPSIKELIEYTSIKREDLTHV